MAAVILHNFKPPLPKRHRIRNIFGNTSKPRRDGKNTVAEDWVDMVEETKLINEGKGQKVGEGLFEVNGRRYKLINGDHLSPHSGPGLHNLTRAEFEILKIMNKNGKLTETTISNLLKNPNYSRESLDKVRKLWELWGRKIDD